MPRPAIWMIAIFVVALGAGLLAGHSFFPARGRMMPPPPPDGERSVLKYELGLSDEQAEKMKGIWSEWIKTGGSRHGDARRTVQKEREDAVVALLTPEQKKEYEKIAVKYNERMNQLGKERDAAFQQAVEKTKAILNDKQREKYEVLMKKGFRGGPPWMRQGGPPGSGPKPGPETMPVLEPGPHP